MSVHLFPIFGSLIVFLFLAVFLTLPWVIYQYRKHAYFNFWRSVIVASLLFYLMTAYFLVILPLPDVRENCADLANTVYAQLQPFKFIDDIQRETGVIWSSPSSWLVLLRARSFYQVIFNVFLLLPLGVYLRYFINDRSKWYYALMLGFFVSLFFEITQRTALFGYFECPYRLFDVDDLMMNTLGSSLGFFLAPMILYFLPSKEEIKEQDLNYQLEQQATYGIQLLEVMIHIILSNFIAGALARNEMLPLAEVLVFTVVFFIFTVLIPALTKGRTLGGEVLRIKQINVTVIGLLKRYLILVLPYLLGGISNTLTLYQGDDLLIILLGLGLTLLSLMIWLGIFLHVIWKWIKKARRPYFNDYAEIDYLRLNKKQ